MPRSRRSGFSMIEVLVVLGILFILAAIVSPVLANSRKSAKRVVDTSGLRQISMSMLMYAGDYDDTLPIGFMTRDNGSWATFHVYPIPANWEIGWSKEYYRRAGSAWANALQPYLRTSQVFTSAVGRDRFIETGNYIQGKEDYVRSSFQFNGYLSTYPHSAIAAPSQLPMVSQNRGEMNLVGYFQTSPRLVCQSLGPCRYQSAKPGCGKENGAIGHLVASPHYSQWVYNKGQLVAFADGSVKWRSMNAPSNAPSDYKTMYWTRLNELGMTTTEWREEHGCHTLLFQPDFDFVNFGTPYEERSSKYAGYR